MSFLALRSPRVKNNLAYPGALLAPTVTTNAADTVATTTANGNGSVDSDGGAAITERGFVWSTSANPTTADNKLVVAGTVGAFSGSLTGLSSTTTYHYRAYAINSVGTSYGADTSFTTATASSFVPTLALMGVG